MTIRHVTIWSAVLWFALILLPQTQDTGDAPVIEEDYRITSVAGRQRAVEDLLKSADELKKSGQLIEAARTLNRVGRFQIRMFLAEEAVTTFQESLKLLEQQPDPKTQIDSLNGLASSYRKFDKYELAEPAANEALTLSRQNSNVAGEAEALLIISDCQNLGDHALAVQTAQQSLALWNSIDRKRGVANAYIAIGEYQMAQHNLAESAKNLEAALNIYRELNDPVQQAEALIYFGYIDYRKADWKKALAYYTQAQSIIDKDAEPYRMGQITIGLGDAFLESGMPEVALSKYQEALDYFRITKEKRAISILKWSIGKANFFAGRYEDAIQSLQTAKSEAQSRPDVTLTAFCDDFLGRTYHAQQNDAAALSHFQSAYDGYSKAKNIREAARVLALMGQVYQEQGHYQKAGDNYQNARETFRFLGDRINESATLYAIGTLELLQNNLDRAAEYLQESIAVTEEMLRVSSSSDLTAAFSARVYDRYESYIDCLMRKHAANSTKQDDVRALETSELARARSLGEMLRSTETGFAPGVDRDLVAREKSLRQSLRVKEDQKVRLLAGDYKRAQLTSLQAELAGLEQDYKEVTETIRARYPSFERLTRPAAWNLRQIQEQIIADDQTVLLEYSLGAEKSYVWAVTRDSLVSYELPPEQRITQATQKIYGLLTAANRKQNAAALEQAGRELSQMVLAPVARHLYKYRIIVVADGALNYIPFQMLPVSSGGDSDELLLASHEVINAPSASILGQLRAENARRHAPTKLLAAIGDPVFESNYAQKKASSNTQVAAVSTPENILWPQAARDIEGDSVDPATIQPLFYSRQELANLRALAGPDTLMITEFEATRERLAQTNLTDYAILHIATHGILDPKRPEKSGLFLSMVNRQGQPQNGFVGLEDVYGLHAPVDLVVLSACRTGLGKDVRGEGLIGLTRGFMYAGASSVIASLWRVDDEATAELMKRFYANMLQQGMTPAAALRAAQNSIRQEPRWRSPYFWAAFTLQGEYRQVIKYTPPQPLPRSVRVSIAFSLLLLFAVGIRWYLRGARSELTT
jgi:CHAT domain-containing protein